MFLRALLLALLMTGTPLRAEELIVAESGGDFSSIQAALDVAPAGTTISVREKPIPYFEKLVFPRSGNVIDGFITLQAFPGDHPVIDGTGVPGSNMVLIDSRSYIKLIGFEIRNNLGVKDGSGFVSWDPAHTSRSATTEFTISAASTQWASRSMGPNPTPSRTW